MTLSLTVPAALWLLLAVPLVWVTVRFGRTNFNPRQRVVQAGVRSLVLALLAFALARPVISTGSSRTSVVFLVDVSHSVASRAITEAAATIDTMTGTIRPDHSKIVVFGEDAAVVADTAALRAMAQTPSAASGPMLVTRDGSDLERALAEARAELLPGYQPRIVLFSDGRETSGDVRGAITRLAADGIPVFVAAMAVRDIGDTWVDSIQLPDRVAAGALLTATVNIGSQRDTTAVVTIKDGTRILATSQAAIAVGTTPVPLDIVFETQGARAIEATVEITGDPLTANNTLSREASVRGRTNVLYVEGVPGSARYLQGALQQSGFDVTVRPPSGLPTTVEDLEPWDVAILSDVSRSAISDATMKSLATWVEQEGGGLLVAGGDAVFGEAEPGKPGGYRNTEIERLSPVTYERKDQPEVALIIILDKSWSMAGQVMELCKAAAQAAIDVLEDQQSVGVVTFNDGHNWDVTLRNVGKHRAEIKKAVAAIEPSGHTLIYPAIEQAFLALKDTPARAKHVVLLSDGRSYPDDYQGLVEKMVAAKMTVSSIAVGPAADVELLTNIAKWGKGRSYVVEDAKEVPQIFVKEAKNATTPAFDEGKTIKVVLKAKGFLEGVDMARAPGLRGRTATVMKDQALQLLATEEGDPLLAFWPIGLGRTAVFASDVKDRWASDWVRWKGYGPFFSSVVHAIERQRAPGLSLDVTAGAVQGRTRSVAVVIEARDAKGNYRDLLKPTVEVKAGNEPPQTLTARQVGPGRYEARVTADASRPVVVSLAGASPAGTVSRVVVPDPNAEYRFRPTDRTLLESIAAATGGKVSTAAEDVRAITGVQQSARRALWPALVLAACGMWFIDILVRRLRFFEAPS